MISFKFFKSMDMSKNKMFIKMDLYTIELENTIQKYIEEIIPYDISSKEFSFKEDIRFNIENKLYKLIDEFKDERILYDLSENVQQTPLGIMAGYYSGDTECMEIDNDKPLLLVYSYFKDNNLEYIKGFALYNHHKIYMIKGIPRH